MPNVTNAETKNGDESTDVAESRAPTCHTNKKAYLKTINITIEDECDDDEDSEVVWFDLDDFDNAKFDNSFVTAQTNMEPLGAWLYSPDAKTSFDNPDNVETFNTSSVTSRNELLNFLRQQKRIIWGEEVPCSTTSWSLENTNPNNCILTMGVNPLITIRPVSRSDTCKDDILITSSTSTSVSQSNRVLELNQLKNYFLLAEPESSEHSLNRFNYKYYLSLLDPSMPRLTNCGHYYRMRYAVYVMPKRPSNNRSMSFSNWRSSSVENVPSSSFKKNQLVHIGEMHLYTIFPKEPKMESKEKLGKSAQTDFIHYENISFFLNQTPLTSQELCTLQMSENDLNQLAINFRRYLKHLNSIIVTVKTTTSYLLDQETFNSTFLLEQLKYPKSSDQFTNSDRFCDQFIRNQYEMFARYYQHYYGNNTQVSYALLDKVDTSIADNTKCCLATSTTTAVSNNLKDNSKDTLNSDMFIANLFRLTSHLTEVS